MSDQEADIFIFRKNKKSDPSEYKWNKNKIARCRSEEYIIHKQKMITASKLEEHSVDKWE